MPYPNQKPLTDLITPPDLEDVIDNQEEYYRTNVSHKKAEEFLDEVDHAEKAIIDTPETHPPLREGSIYHTYGPTKKCKYRWVYRINSDGTGTVVDIFRSGTRK